jgi:hypothetical protein
MSNKKEGILIANPTILDWFVFEHKDEKTILGDLCADIRDDSGFPFGTTAHRQLMYIERMADIHPWIRPAVEEFVKQLKNYQRIVI